MQPYDNTRLPATGAPAAPPRGCATPPPPLPVRVASHPDLPQPDADAGERSSGIPTIIRSESLPELAALRKGSLAGRLGRKQVLLQRAPLTRPRGRCRRRRSPTGAPNQIRMLRASRIRSECTPCTFAY